MKKVFLFLMLAVAVAFTATMSSCSGSSITGDGDDDGNYFGKEGVHKVEVYFSGYEVLYDMTCIATTKTGLGHIFNEDGEDIGSTATINGTTTGEAQKWVCYSDNKTTNMMFSLTASSIEPSTTFKYKVVVYFNGKQVSVREKTVVLDAQNEMELLTFSTKDE